MQTLIRLLLKDETPKTAASDQDIVCYNFARHFKGYYILID